MKTRENTQDAHFFKMLNQLSILPREGKGDAA